MTLSMVPARETAAGQAVYALAKSPLLPKLWAASLGAAERKDFTPPSAPAADPLSLLLAVAADEAESAKAPRPVAAAAPTNVAGTAGTALAPFQAALDAAQRRTGVPATVLGAIVQAEAGTVNGRLNVAARNPRSSAAGLGQFLEGTWIGEAERAGTHLNALAARSRMLDPVGRVRPDAREALLELRYHGETAIQAVADYASANLARLGVSAAGDPRDVLRAAYLGHHLGLGDARTYLGGQLREQRAALLLRAQVGQAAAEDGMARHGSAAAAHRNWLEGFMARKLRG